MIIGLIGIMLERGVNMIKFIGNNEEYTKYSFPSKNIEYFDFGTHAEESCCVTASGECCCERDTEVYQVLRNTKTLFTALNICRECCNR